MSTEELKEVRTQALVDEQFSRPDPPLLHCHAAGSWHEDVRIVGNHDGLYALRNALDEVLFREQRGDDPSHRPCNVMTADGEGYSVVVTLDDSPWRGETWPRRALPYTDVPARDDRERGLLP